MKRKLSFDKHIDKDVVLCRTTSHRVSQRTTEVLVNNAIPFTKHWKHVPFFKREKYHGASEVCVIRINRNTYSKARRALRLMEERDRKRLLVNVI